AQLLAGGSFRDLTRVTTSPPERTAEIVWPNRKSLSKVVENLGDNLSKLQNLLEQGSQADIEKFLASASSLRTISDATMTKVKNQQGNKVISKTDDLVQDFLKHSKSRVIATGFEITKENISYLVNEI
ncbi:MAG: prephenate dehydrogenase/arogenate dehydrogenase family protein, partial [Candidatus Nanopelagicales bacterium]|nr:prephenate dehydrogenase/arogenate dehydrogenase family protein [Candidatus Nanopelagicales bacterium]